MTSICRGLNVGDGKSWVAARMVVTLGTSELGDDTLGATPTPAGGAVGYAREVHDSLKGIPHPRRREEGGPSDAHCQRRGLPFQTFR